MRLCKSIQIPLYLVEHTGHRPETGIISLHLGVCELKFWVTRTCVEFLRYVTRWLRFLVTSFSIRTNQVIISPYTYCGTIGIFVVYKEQANTILHLGADLITLSPDTPTFLSMYTVSFTRFLLTALVVKLILQVSIGCCQFPIHCCLLRKPCRNSEIRKVHNLVCMACEITRQGQMMLINLLEWRHNAEGFQKEFVYLTRKYCKSKASWIHMYKTLYSEKIFSN